MRIEFVCPAAEDSAYLRSLALATLAGLTPPDVQVTLRDDIIKRLDPCRDFDFTADLAAFTVSSKTARRAYELARSYRQHGVQVVMGGIHPTALPEEALQHCDAVVIGEAEGLWEYVVEDARRRQLQRVYRQVSRPSFRSAVRPAWQIFRSRRYVPLYTVQASRGCPYDCEFCSVTPFFGHRLRLRAIEDIVAELRGLERRWVMFADDNIAAHGRYARELFAALQPLGLAWYGQASLQGLQDPALLELMAAAGCKALFIGFESINAQSLADCGKPQNDPTRYLEIVRRIHDHGMAIWGSFVLGLDHDEPDVFERTLAFARAAKLLMATFVIQTPYPGTKLYQRLQREGRLLDQTWWLHERLTDFPLYRPSRMTPEQLYEGWRGLWKEFYSASSILRRLAAPSLHALIGYLPLNLLQRQLVSSKILGGKRFFRRDG